MKSDMSVLLVSNDQYMLPCLVMLDSLFDHNNGEIDVYLIYSDVSSENVEILDSYIQKRGGKFYPLLAQDALFAEVHVFDRDFPKEIFYRLLCVSLLPKELERVLYLDVDILIRGDLSPLYNLDFQGNALAGVINDDPNNVYRCASIGLPKDSKYVNSGVLLFNLKKMRQIFSIDDVVDLTNSNRKIQLGDQDLINIYFQDDILIIPNIYNFHPPASLRDRIYYSLTNSARRSVVIVHYYGLLKPWEYKYHNIFCAEYHRYLKKYMRKGEWIWFICQQIGFFVVCIFQKVLKKI